MEEVLLTIEQVSEYLKVNKYTIYRLVAKGKIPALRVGNQWRFKKALVDEWLFQNSNVRTSNKKSNRSRSS